MLIFCWDREYTRTVNLERTEGDETNIFVDIHCQQAQKNIQNHRFSGLRTMEEVQKSSDS
jgi:hypothetical protein